MRDSWDQLPALRPARLEPEALVALAPGQDKASTTTLLGLRRLGLLCFLGETLGVARGVIDAMGSG